MAGVGSQSTSSAPAPRCLNREPKEVLAAPPVYKIPYAPIGGPNRAAKRVVWRTVPSMRAKLKGLGQVSFPGLVGAATELEAALSQKIPNVAVLRSIGRRASVDPFCINSPLEPHLANMTF